MDLSTKGGVTRGGWGGGGDLSCVPLTEKNQNVRAAHCGGHPKVLNHQTGYGEMRRRGGSAARGN